MDGMFLLTDARASLAVSFMRSVSSSVDEGLCFCFWAIVGENRDVRGSINKHITDGTVLSERGDGLRVVWHGRVG